MSLSKQCVPGHAVHVSAGTIETCTLSALPNVLCADNERKGFCVSTCWANEVAGILHQSIRCFSALLRCTLRTSPCIWVNTVVFAESCDGICIEAKKDITSANPARSKPFRDTAHLIPRSFVFPREEDLFRTLAERDRAFSDTATDDERRGRTRGYNQADAVKSLRLLSVPNGLDSGTTKASVSCANEGADFHQYLSLRSGNYPTRQLCSRCLTRSSKERP